MRKAMFVTSWLAVCAGVLSAAPAQQPLNVKTGTWQIEYNVKYSGLPPEMQAMVDRMTAQQRSAMGLDAPKKYKSCVTQENLNTPWVEGDSNCKWTVLRSTSSDLDVHGSSCSAGKNDGMNTEVDIKIHAVDSEHVRATFHGTSVGDGNNVTLDGNYVGTWTGAACKD